MHSCWGCLAHPSPCKLNCAVHWIAKGKGRETEYPWPVPRMVWSILPPAHLVLYLALLFHTSLISAKCWQVRFSVFQKSLLCRTTQPEIRERLPVSGENKKVRGDDKLSASNAFLLLPSEVNSLVQIKSHLGHRPSQKQSYPIDMTFFFFCLPQNVKSFANGFIPVCVCARKCHLVALLAKSHNHPQPE